MTLLAGAVSASATTYVYVGSWQVDDGPWWSSVANPIAYTGQEAAATIFGGSASNYVISTIDSNPADINFSNWVSTWGGACGGADPCGTVVAQNYSVSTGGFYLTPGDTSAYVGDWATGPTYTNYAFSAVPEVSTWAMMLAGFAGLGFLGARRNQAATIKA
jgi:hypothetical protein